MTQGTSGRITHKHLAEPQDHLIGILQWRAIHQPQQLAYRFLDTAGEGVELGQGKAWNYAELSRRVEAIARQLSSFAGRPVMLAYPAGLDFVAAFFGCLQAGAIAVPVPVPGRHQGLERWWHIFMDVQPHAVLTTQQHGQIQADSADIARAIPHRVTWIVADDPENAPNPVGDRPSFKNLDLDSPALLQYTSGSTRQPRGVIISHRNLMHNLGVIHQRFGHSPDSQGVIWLPPHHDMGLIGGILAPLYGGFPVTLMSPTAFLRQPLRWLQAISAFGGSGGVTSGGPNFAYERCLEKVTAEQRRSLDLSHWDLAFTGAEPVQAKTLIRFADAFADCGFRTSAFHPCYGLAEATLFVSGGAKQEAPAVAKLDRRAIARNRAVESAAPDALPVVSCGQPAADGELLIVDPEMRQPCNSEQIGEIWLTGPSVAQGYWQQPEMTQETFKGYLADGSGPFLRTGDLGFLQQGQLFVTGRLKDLIIIRGQNHYPQDIEQTVAQSHDAVRSQPGATFGLAVDGEERLVVVQEVQRTALRSLETAKVVEAIRAAVSKSHGLQVHAVVLLKPASLPRTTSGKVQRQVCKTGFEAGAFEGYALCTDRAVPCPYHLALDSSSAANSHLDSSTPQTEKSCQRTQDLLQWLRHYAGDAINSRLMDERRCITPGVVLDFGNRGLLGMQVPVEYDGLGLGHREMLSILEQLGAIDSTLALFVGLNNVLGIRPILRAAQPDLKAQWLPRLATGRELAAFALTESGAGSNPNAIRSQVIADGDGMRLYGEKIWSGSAAWAGVLNLFVQHPEAGGISGFVVSKGTAGLRQGPEALTMGMRGMVQNAVYLEGVPVSGAQLLGQPGGGMAIAQDAMQYGRLAIAAACIGGMKRCAQLMLRYSARRAVSTGQLLENPVTLMRLGETTAKVTALSALVDWIGLRLDSGEPVPTEAYTACKILAPEFYWQAADELVQGLGGRGYIETNLAPQILRDARVLRIFEGPTETLAMYLGAQVFNPNSELGSLLAGVPQISERLFAGAQEILARHQRVHDDAVTARRWAYLAVGELGAIAVLWAAQEKSGMASPRGLEWTRLYFEQTLAQALTPTASEAVAGSATATAEWVASYADTIGDIEQTLAGEDHAVDVLLRREATPSKLEKLQQSSGSNTASEIQGWVTSPGVPQDDSHPKGSGSKAPRIGGFWALPKREPAQPTTSAIALEQWLINWLADHLKLSASTIDPDRAFADYGVDSVMAVELAQDLEEFLALSQPLDATLAWNFPTISALASHLAARADLAVPNLSASSWPSQAARQGSPDQSRISPSADLNDLDEAELADLLAAELTAARGSRP